MIYMEETAEVIEVLDRELKIRLRRTAACQHCSSVNLCRPGGQECLTIDKPASLEVKAGDEIRVSISNKTFVWTVLFVYGLPTLVFILTIGLVDSWTGHSLLALVAGFLALSATLFLMIKVDKMVKKNQVLEVAVLGILGSEARSNL